MEGIGGRALFRLSLLMTCFGNFHEQRLMEVICYFSFVPVYRKTEETKKNWSVRSTAVLWATASMYVCEKFRHLSARPWLLLLLLKVRIQPLSIRPLVQTHVRSFLGFLLALEQTNWGGGGCRGEHWSTSPSFFTCRSPSITHQPRMVLTVFRREFFLAELHILCIYLLIYGCQSIMLVSRQTARDAGDVCRFTSHGV